VQAPLTLGKPTQEELEARRAADRIGDPFLVYRDAEGRQHIFSLAERSQSIPLGRREEADISVPWDPEMSRLHAELELRAGEWTVSDDGLSQNGTWVNGMRLAGRRRLSDGDLVRVGRTIFAFCAPGPSTVGPTLVPGELSVPPRLPARLPKPVHPLTRFAGSSIMERKGRVARDSRGTNTSNTRSFRKRHRIRTEAPPSP
jgi:pSer/pThr/pTyr-binding forkhead associated (FHA) protein